MILSATAFAAKDEDVKMGVLVESAEHMDHVKITLESVSYNNLTSALMDLESGKINSIALETCVANYVAARNDKIAVRKSDSETKSESYFSMMTMDSNKEVYDILNNAIAELKADGTLDSLIENELKAYIENDPVAKELPKFDGAKTIKVGVTGDVPPMDFVAVNGKAAGFNIALLTEIANRAQVNIELVQIETGARPIALSSGKVDAVFWTKSLTCIECDTTATEGIEGTMITDSYFTDYLNLIELKSEK